MSTINKHILAVVSNALSQIYKATDCTDVSDCNIALEDIETLRAFCFRNNISTPKSVVNRENSLLKRLAKLSNK